MRHDFLYWQNNKDDALGPIVGQDYDEKWLKNPTHDRSLFYKKKPTHMRKLLEFDIAVNMATSVYVHFRKMDQNVKRIFNAILDQRWLGRNLYNSCW